MHQINAEVAWPDFTDEGVHVRSIHVEQTTLCMQDRGDLFNLLLEDTQSIWIREHERGNVRVHLAA